MIIINIRFKLIVTKKLFSDHSYINDGRHVTKRKFPLLHVGYTIWCRGRSARDIHTALNEIWPDHCPSYSTVARTVSQFTPNARTSFSDAERSGRPVSTSGDDNCGIVSWLIESDPRLTFRDIEEETSIPITTVWRILNNKLEMHNVISYCVSWL